MLQGIISTDWNEIIDVIIRALVSLVVLFLVTKLLGKKQVSQLSVFDYVIGISIGNFAAEMTINVESQFLDGIVAVLVFGLVAYLISVVTMKSIVLRRYFMGIPTILIQHGKIVYNNLKRVKLDTNDLLEECRNHGYFDISDIEFAVLEVNGDLSILPTDSARPVNVSDMKLKVKKQGLCANVIIDGKIMKNVLENINKTPSWLEHELKVKGKNVEDILLATVDIDEKLVLYDKDKDIDVLNVLE